MFRAKLLRCVKSGRNSARRQIVIFLKLRMVNIWRGRVERIGSIFRSDLESLSGNRSNALGLPQFSPIFHRSVTNQPNTRRRIHVEEGMEDFYRLNLTWNEFLRPSRLLLPLNRFFFFFIFSFLFLPRNEAFNIAFTRFLVFFPVHTVSRSAWRCKNPWMLKSWNFWKFWKLD